MICGNFKKTVCCGLSTILLIQMLLVLLLGIIALATYLLYRWWIQPVRLMNYYDRQFKENGINYVKFPYRPLSSPFFEERFADQLNNKDPMYHHKRTYPTVEMVISNHLANTNIIIMEPTLLRQMYAKEDKMERENIIFQTWMSIFGHGMIASEKKQWKKKRKPISQLFQYDQITSAIPSIVEISQLAFREFEDSYWQNSPQDKKKGQIKCDLFQMMKRFTSLIVLSKFLGSGVLKQSFQSKKLMEAIMEMSYTAMKINFNLPVMMFGMKFVNRGWRKQDTWYLSNKATIRRILGQEIAKIDREIDEQAKEGKKSQSDMSTIKNILLQERRKNKKKVDKKLSNYLIDEIVSFTLAGIDSSSTILSSMMMYLFEKPEYAQKLKDEINSIIKSDADITPQNLKKLTYADCVINEISRMISGVSNGFTRRLLEDTEIGGILFKKDTILDNSWINFMYSPKYFQNPMEFNPDRWLESNEKLKEHQNIISLIFGQGQRSCIGKIFALVNIKIMMVKFLRRYEDVLQIHRDQRAYELVISYGVSTTECVLTKTKERSE